MNDIKSFSPKVCIILVNYNGWQDTLECIDSLLSINYPHFNIIIVDNSSTDDSKEHLINNLEKKLALFKGLEGFDDNIPLPINFKHYTQDEVEYEVNTSIQLDKIILITSKKNLGFAGGNNLGTKFALADNNVSFFWYLNNDTIVDKSALNTLVKYYNINFNIRANNLGIVGSKLRYYYNPEVIQAIGGLYNKWSATTRHIGSNQVDVGQFDNNKQFFNIDYIVGASMFVSKEFIRQVGFMNSDYFLYFEEIDWIIRGKAMGFTIGYSAQSIVYHKEGRTTGGNSIGLNKSYLADYYNLKNRINFTRKYYPKYLLTVYLSLIGSILNRIIRKQYARVPMILRIIFNSFLLNKH